MAFTNDGGRRRALAWLGGMALATAATVATAAAGSAGAVVTSHDLAGHGLTPATPPVVIEVTEPGPAGDDRAPEPDPAGDDPATEAYIWCVIDAGSLGVPNPPEACRGIG